MPDRPLLQQTPVSSVLTVREGWEWFRAGYRRYRRNPFLMAFWVLAYWTLLGLAGLIPVLGDLLVGALAPVLLVGVLAGCRALDQETMPPFTLLFSGFGTRLQALMSLGILHFLLTIGALALTAIGDGGVLLQYMARGALGTPELTMPAPEQLSVLGLVLALVAYVPIMLAFAYAPLLVAWRGFGLGKALFFSLVASWRAWRALLGFFLAIVAYGVLLPAVAMALMTAIGLSESMSTALVVVPMMAMFAPMVVSGFFSSYGAILPQQRPDAGASDR